MDAQPALVAVNGTAQRKADPDSYLLHVTVEVRGPAAATVNAQLADRSAQADSALGALTSPQLTIVRGPLSIRRNVWPRDGGGEPVVEWLASRGFTLTDRDTAHAAAVLETVGKLADEVEGLVINGPHWQLDDDNTVHGAVQADAVQAAVVRARRYAEAVGGTLGRLVQISDTGIQVHRTMALSATAPGGGGLGAMDFTPEPVEVSATVEGRWVIDLS